MVFFVMGCFTLNRILISSFQHGVFIFKKQKTLTPTSVRKTVLSLTAGTRPEIIFTDNMLFIIRISLISLRKL